MEDQEQYDQRDRDDHDGGHHGGNVFTAKAVLTDLRDTITDQEVLGVVRDETRPYISVPAFDDLEDHNGHDRWRADRHHDFEKVLHVRCAIYFRGFIKIVRDLLKILFQKIDVEDRCHGWQDQSGEGISESPVRNRDKVSDDHQLRRNHHEGQEKREHQVFAAELKSRECKSGEHDDKHHESRGDDCEDDGIEKISSQVHFRKRIDVVLHRRFGRDELRRKLRIIAAVTLNGRKDHPVERKKHYDPPQGQEGISDGLAHDPCGAGLFADLLVITHDSRPLSPYGCLFADQKVDHRDRKDDGKEDQRGRGSIRRVSARIAVEHVVDIADDGIHAGGIEVRSENGDFVTICFKSTDEARNHEIEDHG